MEAPTVSMTPIAMKSRRPPTCIANWDPATDPESGISCYQYAFGTTPGGTDSVNWTSGIAGNGYLDVREAKLGLSLTRGTRYYASVRAINNAGITGPATNSDGQVVVHHSDDTTPPSAPPAVRDGTGADISTTTSTTQLSANWDNGTDNESGIVRYYYAIGTTPGGNNVVNWTTVGCAGTHVTATGLSLTVGQTYYFSVKSVNGKWLTSSCHQFQRRDGRQRRQPPPAAPANVRDGTGADIAYTTSTTQLSANWDASTDTEERSSAATSMPSAPRPAARKPSTGPLWATSRP